MKPLVFYFAFEYDGDTEDDDVFIGKGFIVDATVVEKFMKKYNPNYPSEDFSETEEYLGMMSYLECDYGVHDWSSMPDDRVLAIGYYSSEVEVEKIDELMEKWRQVFVALGCETDVSRIVDIDLQSASKNDWDIYEEMKVLELYV